jgi:hypothetical protein
MDRRAARVPDSRGLAQETGAAKGLCPLLPDDRACRGDEAGNTGRRVCGQEKPKDVLSPRAQRQKGFAVEKLPDNTKITGEVYELEDEMVTTS